MAFRDRFARRKHLGTLSLLTKRLRPDRYVDSGAKQYLPRHVTGARIQRELHWIALQTPVLGQWIRLFSSEPLSVIIIVPLT